MSTQKIADAAIVIVDVQNDFCPGGALAVPDGDGVVPAINRLVSRFAVVAIGDSERPELVLFTTTAIERGTANEVLRDAGLSGLHSLRRVVPIESLPVLGTGKIDHRSLERCQVA